MKSEGHTSALSMAAPLVSGAVPGLPLHLSGTGDGLQAAHDLLLAGVHPTAGQGGLEYADVPTLALADDEGGVAGD